MLGLLGGRGGLRTIPWCVGARAPVGGGERGRLTAGFGCGG